MSNDKCSTPICRNPRSTYGPKCNTCYYHPHIAEREAQKEAKRQWKRDRNRQINSK